MPTQPYSYISLGQARQELANRLYDSAQVFWSPAELNLYLHESLRVWNALTSFWRDDFLFPSQAGVRWYDLTSLAQMPNTLRPYTLTDNDVYKLIQYHLLEPATGSTWTGSLQFSAADLIGAVQRRRDEILSVCGCTQTARYVPAVGGRITLPDTVIDVRRMCYLPAPVTAQPNSIVWPDDTWAEQSFEPSYLQSPPGMPFTYLLSTQPPISFDTDVPPGYAGQYELLTVEAGPLLVAGTPQTISIPDDWVHVIKWGALADLLSRDSNARDVPRAQYCEQRYRMGLALLSDAPSLLALRVNNVPLQIDAIRAADEYCPSWESQPNARPNTAYHAGLNLIALSPAPDIGVSLYGLGLYGVGAYGYAPSYSLTATVVRNAPVPVLDGDLVQVARDDLDAVIDYAQHIATFKSGGQEFISTMPLFERFLKQAKLYNRKLSEFGEFTSTLYGLSQREEQMNPRLAPEAV